MTKPTILVTGASRGLGAAVAQIAAQMDANVVLSARSEGDLKAVAHQIESRGGRALPVAGDVSQFGDCERMVDEAIQAFNRLDAVVNNAGVIGPIAPIAAGDPQGWQENWAINVLGPFMITQVALPHLRQTNGRVINVSSGAAVSVTPGWAAYCTAKAALNHFTRILAKEEPAITAIALRPGVVDTTMQDTIRREGVEGMPEEVHARFVGYHEKGELLPPEVPGCAVAVLALFAPQSWTGSFIAWNSEEVQSLVRQFACSAGTQNRGQTNA
jgi:NAD(P)-dependent dehydrogenase (short-subunit alcohol dehydrogenase family)